MSRHTTSRVVLALFVSFALATAADAGLLVDFKPDPVSPSMYEIGWTGGAAGQLVQRPGSVGNADGTLPAIFQTPGGLNVQTPLYIVGVPGSTFNIADNSTTFYDVTLQLTGLAATGATVQTMLAPGMVMVSQLLGAGAFTLLSTDPDGAGSLLPTVLLTGTISDAAIVGFLGQSTASIQSSNVSFTGGAIDGGSSPGTLSWSLIDIGGGLKVLGTGSLATLQSFNANMVGILTPEPATMCLMGLGLGAIAIKAGRRRK